MIFYFAFLVFCVTAGEVSDLERYYFDFLRCNYTLLSSGLRAGCLGFTTRRRGRRVAPTPPPCRGRRRIICTSGWMMRITFT
jgi:hypothetical protein